MGILGKLFGGFFDWQNAPAEPAPPTINPANGLPMVDGPGSVDVMGNPYGFDHSQNVIETHHDWQYSSPTFSHDYWSSSSSSSCNNDWP